MTVSHIRVLFGVVLLFCSCSAQSESRDTAKSKASPKDTIAQTEDTSHVLSEGEVVIIADSVLRRKVTNAENENWGLAIWISLLSAAGSLALAFFAWKQYQVVTNREASYLTVNTFVERISTPPPHTSTKQYVKNHIELYMRMFNTGDTAIDDIWIALPRGVSISVPTTQGRNFDLEVFRIKRAIMPGDRMTVKFDGDYFFGQNISFAADQKHEFTVAFKNPKESSYHTIRVPFKIREQEDNPEVDYEISVENGIKVVDQDMHPRERSDFDSLPKQ